MLEITIEEVSGPRRKIVLRGQSLPETKDDRVVLGATMAAVYGLLYALVVSEQYSLLVGALVLLGVVGLLMYLTRRVDWYADLATAVRRPAATG